MLTLYIILDASLFLFAIIYFIYAYSRTAESYTCYVLSPSMSEIISAYHDVRFSLYICRIIYVVSCCYFSDGSTIVVIKYIFYESESF